MTVSLLDTNIILDDYYEKRENHGFIMKFVSRYKYGELGYTSSVLTECVEVVTKAFVQFSTILNNALTNRSKVSKQWNDLGLEKRREFVSDLIQHIKTNPERYDKNAPFLMQLFEVLSINLEFLTEDELRELSTTTVPNIIMSLTSYLRGRFTRTDPYFPATFKELEEKSKKIGTVLSSIFIKPYDSYDMKIAFDILMLILWGNDKGVSTSEVTFYTNDVPFLNKLKNLKEKHMNVSDPDAICKEDQLKYFNPYSEEILKIEGANKVAVQQRG